jgi:membrane protease YdiL (CAAX protease family)
MDSLEASPPPAIVDPPRIGRPRLAWGAIVVLVAVLMGVQLSRGTSGQNTALNRARMLLLRMQAQYLVGAEDLFKKTDGKVNAQVTAFNTGPVEQRWRFIVLVGELSGPDAALHELHHLDEALARNHIELTEQQRSVDDVLRRAYQDYTQKEWAAPSVSETDRLDLRRELGWFGQLALAPATGRDKAEREQVLRPALRTMKVLLALFAAFVLLGLGGAVGLLILVIALASRKLQGGLRTGSPCGAVYAETFALWLGLTLALNFAVFWWPWPNSRFLMLGCADLLSLTALVWPLLRGVSWRQVRRDIGWTAGRQPALEPMIGAGGYALTIPLLLLGLLLTALLVQLRARWTGPGNPVDDFGPSRQLAHPLIAFLATGGWWERVQVLLVAAVVAPLVEETMFRGVLYRHLREASCRLGFAASVLGSAVLVSLIFAAIHPQGLAAIPPLMALALGFNLLREWRGTLLPSMVAHAINNGVLLLVFLFTLGT